MRTLDAYDESEQRSGFFTMLDDHLAVPFETRVLGVSVIVTHVDLTPENGVVAVCRRTEWNQRVPILDLPLPTPPPAGAEWIEAYRPWCHGG